MIAIDFLNKLRPGGPWVLTAIIPDGPTETITARDADAVGKFIDDNNGKKNLYYSVNPTRTVMAKKTAKTDIAAIEYVLADLDPEGDETPEAAKARYQKQLQTFEPRPTLVVDSGNGLQCLWRLQEPITLGEPKVAAKGGLEFTPEDQAKIADVEARAKTLMLSLGSVAGTQNIDRILRLPGTVNLPGKKKISDGRVACLSRLLLFTDATHALEDFSIGSCTADRDLNATEQHNCDESGSGYGFRFMRACHAKQMSYEQALEAILADTGKGGEWARRSDERQHKRAWERSKAAVDSDVAKLNEDYALVIIGDKGAILKTTDDNFQLLTIPTFELWFANVHVQLTETKRSPLAKHWLHHQDRRQYEGIVFAPGRETPKHFNLWRGFAFKPKPGQCSKFLNHIKENICRGDEVLYRWVIGWFADIFQHPDKKKGTSLGLRGRQGTGKTKVGQVIGSLLGAHYVPVSDPRFVTGRFNSHLVACLLLHADEGFWAGDKQAEGRLKDLVTGDDQFIEYKGKEPVQVKNYLRLLVTGNQDWLVPAGFEERRFVVLDVGEGHMQDQSYFAAIDDEMDNGGREALLDHLLKFDLTEIDLRTIPKTAALLDQKMASLTAEQSWWLDVLMRGELPWGCDLPEACPSSRLFDRYIQHAQKQGVRRRSIETNLGIFLTKYVPGLTKNKGYYNRWDGKEMNAHRSWVYTFPPLDECRKAFAKAMQQDIPWPEATEAGYIEVNGVNNPCYVVPKEAVWFTEPPPDTGIREKGAE